MPPAARMLAIAMLPALLAPAIAAATPGTRPPGPRAAPTAPAFDVRDSERAQLQGRAPRGFAATSGVRDARRAYARSLGPRAVLDIDPLTQTPRVVQRLNGALSGTATGAPATIALDYVRARTTSFGLTASDLATLGDPHAYTSSDGVTHLRWIQSYRGIPAYDNGLRVNVDRDGRVVDVIGSPRHDLSVASTTPVLDAAQALVAVQAQVGGSHGATVRDGPSGPTRATTFAGGDSAHLVLFGAGTVHLAWDVIDAASPAAVYDAVVDASTGDVLSSENLVDFDGAVSVFAHYPGAPGDDVQQPQDITPYLTPGATTLVGPNAHAFSDVNDDRVATDDPGQPDDEEVPPSSGLDWVYPFTAFTSNPDGGCLMTAECSWDNTLPGSWATNRAQATTQLFWFVNEYHDHLLADPIDFDDASGAFDGDDPLQARSEVGAALGTDGNPDAAHLDNASMFTPRDGDSPTMTMELFSSAAGAPFRDVDSADDAAIVFHEYTHGLSNRLITNNDGTGALTDVQSAAMGEGWSDWYALDELVDLGLDTDTPTPGEVDFGDDTDATPHASRSEPIDCPVGAPTANCPNGGYTYGQLGQICGCGNEPHFDGEIWGQTLWDLRTALGSTVAEQLITGAMRLSPPQPSMLDERNAILAENATLPLADRIDTDVLWTVFAQRGMGWFASTTGANDGAPIEDFSLPPDPPAPGSTPGTVTGTVTDAISGLPINGVRAGFGGHDTSLDPAFGDTTLATLTDGLGHYTLTDIPAGTYPQLSFDGPVGYDVGVAGPLTVADGQTLTRDAVLRRDWAAAAGGAGESSTDPSQAGFGCGDDRLIDQSPRGWSTDRSRGQAAITITLPQTIDVTGFAINPAATCGDDATAGLRQYRIETSTDGGATFATAAAGLFAPTAAGHLNELLPTGHASRITHVRLTMLNPQCVNACNAMDFTGGAYFVDATELEVFGAPPNVLPSGTLTATPDAVDAGATQVSLQAVFTDPDSKITGYAWDFDGDGTIDQTTTTPTVTHVYTAGGTFTATVAAQDFRGGAGTATAHIRVTPAPIMQQPAPTTTTTVATIPAPAPTTTTTATTPLPPAIVRAAAPRVKLSASGRRGIAFTVTFATRGTVRATLTVSQAMAKTLRLRSPSFAVRRLNATVPTARPTTLTIRLSTATLASLSRRRLTRLNAVLGVSARAADGQVATATRHVTIAR